MAGELIAVVVPATILIFLRWALKNYGDWTLACIFRTHDCSQHFRCPCPHHDEVIHEAMKEPT